MPAERFELSDTVSKTGCYSNSRTLALWCTGEDLNLRVPLGETGLQPVRFGLANAPVPEILRRKVRGSGFRPSTSLRAGSAGSQLPLRCAQDSASRPTVNALRTREHAEDWQRKEHGDKHDTSDGERFRQSLRLEYQGAKDALS